MDELIQRFYSAFNEHDGAAMAACYTPDAHFSDPVFTDLHGAEPGAMWTMLTARADDLRVELVDHHTHGDTAHARWIAHYTFTRTGNKVVNDVRASFVFRDGLIADHHDEFSFWRWARQALGPSGIALGWSPIVRNAVRKQARADLERFMNDPR